MHDEKQTRPDRSCRYNDHVRCEDVRTRQCGTCGWNPKVQQDRKRQRRHGGD